MEETEVTVESVRDVGPDTVAIELAAPPEFDALPGQFVLLRAEVDGEEVARHYTLSSPAVTDTFEVTVGVDPDGDLSPYLADVDPGTSVRVEGPFGRIAYEGAEDVVAVAGGPGVGPAVAIAEAAHGAGHEATVVYRADEPAHQDRLAALEDGGADVLVLAENDDADLADAVGAHLGEGRYYVFGFEAFVTTVAEAIEDAGGDADDALIENFG